MDNNLSAYETCSPAGNVPPVMCRNKIVFATLLLLSMGGTLAGCGKAEAPLPPVDTRSSHGAKKVTTIDVPPEVAKSWKSVTIAVLNKSSMAQKSYTVPIGGKLVVPSSNLTIEVETFLPAFIMHGTTITSSSNQLRNPAAKVRVSDKNTTIFYGWLFALHPNTHVMIHPNYSFSLQVVQPSGKK